MLLCDSFFYIHVITSMPLVDLQRGSYEVGRWRDDSNVKADRGSGAEDWDDAFVG